jgi:spore coat protein A, manganese oxidase
MILNTNNQLLTNKQFTNEKKLKMKTKKKIYTKGLFAFFMMLIMAVNVYATVPPVTRVGTATFAAGTYTVPINVSGFVHAGNITMTLLYDATKLTFTGINLNAGLNPSNAQITLPPNTSGKIKLKYNSLTDIVLASPTTELFNITFTVKPGVQGVKVPLSWSTSNGDNKITPPFPGQYVPPITVFNMSNYFINGFIKIPPVPVITGPALVCSGTNNIYSTASGMLSYVWTVSSGGSIIGGIGTKSVTVRWDSAGPQNVSVTYTHPTAGPAVAPTEYDVDVNENAVPTITGLNQIGNGVTVAGYETESDMTDYLWTLTGGGAGVITDGQGTDSITVTWTNPTGAQFVNVSYTSAAGCPSATASVYEVIYYPFADPIDPFSIPQFVDPLPHFAAGLRVDAKAGGNLIITAAPLQHIALSTGTILGTDTVGSPKTPNAGSATYFGYSISKDGGNTFTPPYWPAFTIEAQQGHPITVEGRNELYGKTYFDVNIAADQTIMMHGVPYTGDPMTDPYTGPIPLSIHLHGGEVPSNSDGGPDAWYTPGYALTGPGWNVPYEPVTAFSTYPNAQEAATLWFHEHSQVGLTAANVYAGMAGFYFLRGTDEETDHLPGWSGDDKVREITPAGKTATFNGANSYLPEIEIAFQDRMFNVNGGLYYPAEPTNPDIHPYWGPEFFGDIWTVNGKTWPYLSVAPRKYRFRMLGGCQARMVNVWLQDLATGANAPSITVVGTDGGLLDHPVTINPANGEKLLIGGGERYDVVIDFTGVPAGTVFTLMNDGNAPYPDGDPVIPGLTDRLMQFVVNGELVSTANPANSGIDKSAVPFNLRPGGELTKLTNFDGTLNTVPVKKRQLVLNEVSGPGGPIMVCVNNSRMASMPGMMGQPAQFGDPTETPTEGTTEMWTLINTTMDAHPMHIHLLQWQLVGRQNFDAMTYMMDYSMAFGGAMPFPMDAAYPGGSGSPYPYDSVNADGAVGGNPAISPYLQGNLIPADLKERGWKDVIIIYPGQVATYIVRVAPTHLPLTATQQQLQFPFDPSGGPGYVWHCHIVEHEDNDMMRPLNIMASPMRYPQITTQPIAANVCVGDVANFAVVATSANPITYQWQISANGGSTWTDIVDGVPYSGALTASLTINPSGLALNTYKYRVVLTNVDGVTTSNAALLSVNYCVQISSSQNIGTTLLTSWSAVTGASGYIVQYRLPGGNWINKNTSVNNAKLTGLTPGMQYECKLTVYKNGTFSGSSTVQNFVTANVSYTESRDIGTTIKINWNNFSPWATSCTFQYRRSGTNNWINVNQNLDNAKVTSLLPETNYDCRVMVYIGFSLWGTMQTGTFTTGKVNFTTSNISGNQLTLTWTSFTPWATSYRLYYRPQGSFIWITKYPGANNSYQLPSLIQGVNYECYVDVYANTLWGSSQRGTFSLPHNKNLIVSESTSSISGISFYPNPTEGILYITTNGIVGKAVMDIYSIDGQKLYTEKIENAEFVDKPVDLSLYPKGMYFIRFEADNYSQVEKVIVD